MTVLLDALAAVMTKYSIVTAFAVVGGIVWLSYVASARLTRGRIHGSAIAILVGLALAYCGGSVTGGKKGLADIEVLAGIGIMGGAIFRDFAIVATAFGVRIEEFRRTGLSGIPL